MLNPLTGTGPHITITWTGHEDAHTVLDCLANVDPRSIETVQLMSMILRFENLTPDAIEGTPAELALLDALIARSSARGYLADWRTMWREQAV